MLCGVIALTASASEWLDTKNIAFLDCKRDVDVNGTRQSVSGVTSWPLNRGDLITTFDEPAYLRVNNGVRFVLQRNSRARIVRLDTGEAYLHLVEGALTFEVPPVASALICAVDRLVKPGHESAGRVDVLEKSAVRAMVDKGVVESDERRFCTPKGPAGAGLFSKRPLVITMTALAGAGAVGAGIALRDGGRLGETALPGTRTEPPSVSPSVARQ
ncbi:MAG: hypothetical protein U0Q16_39440 [Bryobacteraceae bacterium]